MMRSVQYSALPSSSVELAEGHPLLKALFPRSIGRVPPRPGEETRRKRGMDEYILQYCAAGQGWFDSGRGRERLEAGSCIVIPPKTPHAYGSDDAEPWDNYWIHFRGSQAKRYCEALGLGKEKWLLRMEPSREVVDCFEKILAAYREGHGWEQLLDASAWLNRLLTLLVLGGRNAGGRSVGGVERSIRFMKENVRRKLSLEELAEVASLSKARYHEVFRERIGQAPMSYFSELKIGQAGEALLSSGETVESIALQFGFPNAFYFSRVFKKTMGMPPSQYRKQYGTP